MLGDGSGVVVRRRPLVWGLARFQVGCAPYAPYVLILWLELLGLGQASVAQPE